MPNILVEKTLTFTFPDSWQVIQYDKLGFYRDHVHQCQGTEAIDFLALSEDELFLIEVKDFRHYRIENKQRIMSGELAVEVAQKVRDTIASLYAAYRWQTESLKSFYEYLCKDLDTPPKITVVLFLEQDRSATPSKSFQIAQSHLKKRLKHQLQFLNVRCDIYNKETLPKKYGWQVTG